MLGVGPTPEELLARLRATWANGQGEPRQVQAEAARMTAGLPYYMLRRELVPSLAEIADGPFRVPALDVWLHDVYLHGAPVPMDRAKALSHLQRAASENDPRARLQLGTYLLGDPPFGPELQPDPAQGLAMLREVADFGPLGMEANPVIGRHLIRHPPPEYSSDDHRRIDFYGEIASQADEADLLALARYWAARCSGTDYAADEYRRARGFLLEGVRRGSPRIRQVCSDQLDAWGCRPPPPPPAAPPPSAAQKAATVAKTAGIVGGIGVTLWVWWTIGIFLLGVVAAINAVMIPVLLVVGAIALVISRFRGK